MKFLAIVIWIFVLAGGMAQGQPPATGSVEVAEGEKPDLAREDLTDWAKARQEQRDIPGESIHAGMRLQALALNSRMQEGAVPLAVLDDDEEEEEETEDVRARDQWWFSQRVYPAKGIPTGVRNRAVLHRRKMRGMQARPAEAGEPKSLPVAGVCNWLSIGPRNINGRIRSMAIHPTNGDIIYAGAAEGGVWRSSDAGQTWHPQMQYELSLAVGDLAIDPTNPDVIYVGTGEPTQWPGYEGVGVLKSTDDGVTWSSTGPIGNGHIARLEIDPTDTDVVYCAGFPGGLYRTADGGGTWSLILSGDVTDFALHPTSTDTMYAGKRHDGVHKSTDGGANWTKLAGGLPATVSNRVMLSLCNASPNTVYAKLDKTVYKTTDAGATWTDLGDHGGTTFGYWCNYVAVDPTDPDIIFAGGQKLERSTDGGATWSEVMGGSDAERDRLHVDQHAMVFDPGNPQRIYAGNDGGVFLSTDGGDSWKKVSDGLIVTQFYDVGISPAVPTLLGGGTQDQGTNVTDGGLTWHKVFGADGGFVVFHPTDRYTVYGEMQHNNIRKSTDGGASWVSATTGLTGAGPWIGAIVMDQNSPDTLFTGRLQVFRTTDGAANWTASSPAITGQFLALAIAPSDSNIVYAGARNGSVWKSTDGGATLANWSDVTASPPLPNRVCTDLAVDRSNPDIVYATYSGFNTNTSATPGHVFRSADGGTTWTNISGTTGDPSGLPDMPATAIEIDGHDPNTLYVGTDIGMFRTTNLGALWTVFEPGLPLVAVTDLKLDAAGNTLTAATHGRGMWQIRVAPSAACADVDVFVRDHHLDTGQHIPSFSGVVDPLSVVRGGSQGEKVYRWQSPDIKVDREPFYTPDAFFDGVEFDRDLIHDSPARTQPNRVYVQVHNRGPLDAQNVNVKALWADATGGLPPLPADFWSAYPNDSTDTSVWHPLGTYKTISKLEPTRPVVLSWDWTPPATAADHTCLLVVVDGPDDPIPASNKQLNVNWLIGNEKHVGLKNLHVIDVPPGPQLWRPTFITFYNATQLQQNYDFLIRRETFPVEGRLLLTFPELKTVRPLRQSVEGADVWRQELWHPICCHHKFFHRVFGRQKARRLKFFRHKSCRQLDPRVDIDVVANEAAIRQVVLGPQRPLKAGIRIAVPPNAKPGDTYRFTVLQKDGQQVLGGSTYEIRVQDR